MPIGPDTDIEFFHNMYEEYLATYKGEFGDIDFDNETVKALIYSAMTAGAKYVYKLEKAHPGNCSLMFSMLGYEKKAET